MVLSCRWFFSVLVLGAAGLGLTWAQEIKYAIKTGANPPPKELSEAVRSLLGPKSVRFFDPKGKAVAELWFRQEIPATTTPAQIKKGVTYRDLKQSEILGAVRFEQNWKDYRKQKIKAGVYTLRLGFQPQDGDHTGSSPHTEFLVVLSAAKDTTPKLMEYKELVEASMNSIDTSHPGSFMLFPNPQPASAPMLVSKEDNHLALFTSEKITVGGKKVDARLGIGLTLVGYAN